MDGDQEKEVVTIYFADELRAGGTAVEKDPIPHLNDDQTVGTLRQAREWIGASESRMTLKPIEVPLTFL